MNDFSFAVFGDMQMHNEITSRVVELVRDARPDLCIVLGDLVNDGSNMEFWQKCRNTLRPLEEVCEVAAIPGNHDYAKSGGAELFRRFFRKPGEETFVSFRHARCRFLLLDTVLDADLSNPYGEGGFPTDRPQMAWLKKELRQAKALSEPSFVFAHHPIFMPIQIYECTSPAIRVDDSDGNLSLGNILPVLLHGETQMFFAGHLHIYERSMYEGTHFITTGATGFELPGLGDGGNRFSELRLERNHFCRVDVRKDGINCVVIDEYGELMDKWNESFRCTAGTSCGPDIDRPF